MDRPEKKIEFHYLVQDFYFPNRDLLKKFLLKQIEARGRKVESINYIFCDDNYLLNLNTKYLKHNTLTDIITFELSSAGDPLISDIYVSIERVRDNSEKFHTTFIAELLRVIFHGVLHLLGFSDKTSAEQKTMRSQEEELMRLFEISRGTKKRD